ncbi:uncharacterized protein LOC144875503 [Branchiostoma floridae x Branchiostoma japonicum]
MLRKGELSLLGEKKGRILHRKGLVNYNHLRFQLGMLEQEKRKAEFQLRSKQDQVLQKFRNLRKRRDEIRKDTESRERSPRKTCDVPSKPLSSQGDLADRNEEIFRAEIKNNTARKRWSVVTCAVGSSQHILRLRGLAAFNDSRRHSVAGVPSYIGRSERSKIHEIDGHLATKDASVTKRRESLDPAMLAAMLDVDSSTVELDAQVYARVRLPPTVVRKSLEIIDGEEHKRVEKTVATVTRQRRVSVACPNWTVKTNGRRLPPLTSGSTSDMAFKTNDTSDVNGGTITLPAITITHPQPTVHSQSDKQGHASSTDSCLGLGTKSKPRKSSITFAERNILKEDNY